MRVISTKNIEPGMKLGTPLRSTGGSVLRAPGVSFTPAYIDRIKQMGVPAVYIDDPDTVGITPPEILNAAFRQKVLGNLASTFNRVASFGSLHEAAIGEDATTAFERGSAELKDSILSLVGNIDTMLDQLVGTEVLRGLNSIKSHDDYTFQHSIDVTITGILLARKAAWPKVHVRSFAIGCLLHDIGKVFINPAILNKNGPLTDEEYAEVKKHPTLGYQLIRATAPNLGVLIPQVAYQHHERQDGSGYPRGLRGGNTLDRCEEIDDQSQIHKFGAVCAVADVYDALTSNRSYREGYTPDRVYDAIRRMSGAHLNSQAVRIFERVIAPFPICSEVRVTSGKYENYLGVVARVPPFDLAHPIVRILQDPSGNRIEPFEINLGIDRDITLIGTRGGQNDDRKIHIREALKPPAPPKPLPSAVEETLKKLQAKVA
jgi:HD-GYP domain-containing protein (c-di-GMP phosphodiesterase class II)